MPSSPDTSPRGPGDTSGPVRVDTSVPMGEAQGVATDVTARRAADEEVRRHADTFQALIQDSPFGIYVIDADFRLAYASRSARRTFGAAADPLIGSDLGVALRAIWPEPFATEAIQRFRHTLDTGEPYVAMNTVEHRADRDAIEAYDWRIERILMPDARHGVVCYFYDMTKRHELEAALRLSEQRLQLALDSAHMGTFVWHVAEDRGEPDRRARKLFGLPAGSPFTLDQMLALVHPADRERYAAAIRRACDPAGAGMLQEGIRVRHPGGRECHLVVTGEVRVAEEPRQAVTMAGTVVDVTDRLRTEEQLQQVQRVQSVGTLAGGVAHEVNNQMTVVIGFGTFVLSSLGRAHPQYGDVAEMVKAAERASRVSQELLTFSRRQVSTPRTLDLRTVVEELRPVLARLAGADQRLHARVSNATGLVRADPGQIGQILINLVANARDAMPTGGTVTITVEDVDLREARAGSHGQIQMPPGDYVLLAVSDTGQGMARETLAQIFEPFFTTKPVGQGTGLGLSTVYGIVKQSGGFVWAYSEPGTGTTIKVYLPALPAGSTVAATPVPPPDAPGPSPTGLTVLLVEDEPAVRAIARRTLEAEGYRVEAVSCGADALALVRSGAMQPDLLVSDVVMPGMSGRELGEALRELLPDLPVLYLSGYPGEAITERGLLAPGAHFIQKPFAPARLVREVSAMAPRQRQPT